MPDSGSSEYNPILATVMPTSAMRTTNGVISKGHRFSHFGLSSGSEAAASLLDGTMI
jgi:hypothetical protein